MWYLFATWLVMSSISCSLFKSWWMRHTSSIHSSESSLTFDFVSYPRFLCFSSLAISSIRVAYSITDSTPPCLRLSLCQSFLLARISCVCWCLGLSWVSLSFSGFSLQRRWCLRNRVLHQARPCRRLYGHLGRLCMRCVLYLVLLGLFVWGLSGDRLWSTHFFRLPGVLWLWFVFSLSHWWFFRGLSLHCWPVWCLLRLSISLSGLSLCRVLWFHLLPSLGGGGGYVFSYVDILNHGF